MAHRLHVSTPRTGSAAETLALLASIATAAKRPANLLAGLVLFLGWAALLSWTGNGPGGWQVRTCADLDLASRACTEVQLAKDQGRVVPHDAGFRS